MSIMSKFIVVESGELRIAVRKERVDEIAESYDEKNPVNILVGENLYTSTESFDSLLAKLEG